MRWSPQELCQRAEVIDTQHRYALGIDRRDWALYRSAFAERVWFDFTSWHGGEPAELNADEWVERVAERQTGFDATHHQMTNHYVTLDGPTAQCITYIIARHVLRSGSGDRIQAIGGYYTNRLSRLESGWKITHCRLTAEWSCGDRGLFDEAAERVKNGTAPAGPARGVSG